MAVSEKPFERVWALIVRIPRGKVATYGQLSRLIERRLTPVGIGWAIRAAAEGAIPWHRVVNGQGGVSTDKETPGLQRSMLRAEGVRFDRAGFIDLDRYGWQPSPDDASDDPFAIDPPTAPIAKRRKTQPRVR
jgi:methylated-DNA-protein-cysteine methyltransferase-like protein